MRKLRMSFPFLQALVTGIGMVTIGAAINSYVIVQINASVNSSATAVALLGQGLALFTTVITWTGIVILIVSASFVVRTWRGAQV